MTTRVVVFQGVVAAAVIGGAFLAGCAVPWGTAETVMPLAPSPPPKLLEPRILPDGKIKSGLVPLSTNYYNDADGADGADGGAAEERIEEGTSEELESSSLIARQYSPYGNGGNNNKADGSFVYCYPFTYEEVLTKCGEIKSQDENVVGLYLPLMMEVQQKHEDIYYKYIQELILNTGLKVVGVAYDNPRWNLITEIVNEYPKLFAGVIIEWIGSRACVNQILNPKFNHLESIRANTSEGILRYFFREQNLTLCDTPAPLYLAPAIAPPSTTSNPLPFPEYFEPVFACFGGYEGLCYKALSQYPELACSSHQRYCFNPYELGGGRLLHLMNETCSGLHNIDYYGTI